MQQIQALENERNLLLATEHQLQRKLQQQKEEEEAIREKLEVMNNLVVISCFDYFYYAYFNMHIVMQNADLGRGVSVTR